MNPSLKWFAGLALLFMIPLSCSLFTKENARTILDLSKTACIVANAELGDETVQQVCGVVDALVPDMRRLLAEQRKASRAYASSHAGACGPQDAGADR